MKKHRDIILLVALLAALIIFTVIGLGSSADENADMSVPTTHSSAPHGALALMRWTESLGYDAQRLEYTSFVLDEQDDALVVLNPTELFNRTQSEMVLDWVEAGGVLLLAHDFPMLFGGNPILDELDMNIRAYNDQFGDAGEIARAPVMQPVLHAPSTTSVLAQTSYVLNVARHDAASLVGVPLSEMSDAPDEGQTSPDTPDTFQAVVVGVKHGQGYIYVSSATYPFTNEGLRDNDNAALVLNMLRRVPPGGRIQFDEWHHGYFTPPSLRSTMMDNPWGQAVIYSLVVVALFLVANGRRLGKPVPLPETLVRRSSAEYIESMADMYRRGKKRDFIQRHYYTSLKRRLARSHAINPHQDNAAFVRELARYRDIDEAALLALLERLERGTASENDLLTLVDESDSILPRR